MGVWVARRGGGERVLGRKLGRMQENGEINKRRMHHQGQALFEDVVGDTEKGNIEFCGIRVDGGDEIKHRRHRHGPTHGGPGRKDESRGTGG